MVFVFDPLHSSNFLLRATHWVLPPAFFAGKLRENNLFNTIFSSQNGGVVEEICTI